MTHNSMCASARSPQCRCSCGGSLHGGFSGGRRSRKGMKRISQSGLLSNITNGMATSMVVGAAATIFPPIVPLYQAYSIAKIGIQVYDAYNKSKNKDGAFDEVIKYSASEASEKLYENKATQIAKNVRLAAESAGIIAQISGIIPQVKSDSKTNEDIYGSMLEGSIKSGILSGMGNLASYTVGSIVS